MQTNIKKHIGIILIAVGLILTMDKTAEFNGLVNTISFYIQEYWPMLLLFLGVYLLSSPKKDKKS